MGPRPPGEILCDEERLLNLDLLAFNGVEVHICTCFKCHKASQKKKFKKKMKPKGLFFYYLFNWNGGGNI